MAFKFKKPKYYELHFLTKKGEAAYREIDEAGERESGANKRIVNAIYKEQVKSETPLIIRILLKIPRLAFQTGLEDQIVEGLEKAGAVRNKDYELRASWRGEC